MDWRWETEYIQKGYPERAICGVDEAGRGPLAGDVYAAAVILPYQIEIKGLNDSKKISHKRREEIYEVIRSCAISYAFATASVEEIEQLNILGAAQLAMRRAVSMLSPAAQIALIDGNIARDFDIATQTVIGGDAVSPSIATASIVAKVERDRYMLQLHERYPMYGFDKHMGYPTALHKQMIAQYGLTEVHRKGFKYY